MNWGAATNQLVRGPNLNLDASRRACGYFRWLLHILTTVDQNRRERPAQVPGARSHPGKVSQATYWRRRITVLGAAVALLTGLSWAVNGMLTASSTAGQASPADSTGATGPTPAQSSKDPAVKAPSPSPRSSTVPAKHRAARRAHAPRGHAGLYPWPRGAQRFGPAVLFSARQDAHLHRARCFPGEARPCRLNMSPEFVSVVIAAGDRRIWSSADCASGAGSNMVVIASGKPAALRVSWDRRTSSPGCGGSGQLARPGEYQVRAVAGRLHSRSVNFVLGAQGVSGP